MYHLSRLSRCSNNALGKVLPIQPCVLRGGGGVVEGGWRVFSKHCIWGGACYLLGVLSVTCLAFLKTALWKCYLLGVFGIASPPLNIVQVFHKCCIGSSTWKKWQQLNKLHLHMHDTSDNHNYPWRYNYCFNIQVFSCQLCATAHTVITLTEDSNNHHTNDTEVDSSYNHNHLGWPQCGPVCPGSFLPAAYYSTGRFRWGC